MLLRHVRTVGHCDENLRARDSRRDTLDQRKKRQVEEHDAIFRMVDDVRELINMQTGVQRMQHGPGPRHGKVQLHVTVAVPRQRRYPLARLDAEACEGVCHAARALREIPVPIPVYVAFDPS